MRFRRVLALVLALAGAIVSRGAEASSILSRLQDDFAFSGPEGVSGAIRIEKQTVTPLGKQVEGVPFYGSDGVGKIELLSGNRVLIVGKDRRHGNAEIGVVFQQGRLKFDAMVLRSGDAEWTLSSLTPEGVADLLKETKNPGPRSSPTYGQTLRTSPAIFPNNVTGASRLGPFLLEGGWSSHGAYLQGMADTMQAQWERLITENNISSPATRVTIKFVIESSGKIVRIVDVSGTAGDRASRACMSAITNSAPFGEWTDEMKKMLGKKQELTLEFYYY